MKTNGMAATQNDLLSVDGVEQIRTRDDLATFVAALLRDLQEHPDSWENSDLPSFLEALGAWVNDMPGFYKNRGEPVPEQPSWRTLAQILSAARVYE